MHKPAMPESAPAKKGLINNRFCLSKMHKKSTKYGKATIIQKWFANDNVWLNTSFAGDSNTMVTDKKPNIFWLIRIDVN